MQDEPIVLQVLPELLQGGVERGTLDIALALKNDGFESFVCSNGGKLVSQLDGLATHFKLPVHSKNPITMICNIFKLKKIIEDHNINIVHARSRAPAWSCYFACKLTGCNFITTFHGAYSAEHALKRFYNSVMLRGKRVIAISNYIKKHLEIRYHCHSDRVVVIHRGADLDYFNPKKVTQERISAIKKELGVELKGKVILMPARVSRMKGHLYMIKALKYLDKKEFTFLIVGATTDDHFEYRKEIETKAKEYGLEERVFIRPSVTDMPALYSISDIIVCPKIIPEAFGRTIVEAQAMSKVVIATRIGGPAEIIEENKTGFLVSPSDPSEMTDTLRKIMKMDSKALTPILKAARKKVEDMFSISKMCASTIEVYKEVLKS